MCTYVYSGINIGAILFTWFKHINYIALLLPIGTVPYNRPKASIHSVGLKRYAYWTETPCVSLFPKFWQPPFVLSVAMSNREVFSSQSSGS